MRKEDERLEKEGFTGKKIATFIVCDRMESYVSYIRRYRPDIFETVSKDENGVEKESIYTYDGLNEEDEKFLKTIEPEELYDKIINGENPYIIDTRGSMAFKNNNIKGSINITDTFFDEIIENVTSVLKRNSFTSGGFLDGDNETSLSIYDVGANYLYLTESEYKKAVKDLESKKIENINTSENYILGILFLDILDK